jgi:hypothetical protein
MNMTEHTTSKIKEKKKNEEVKKKLVKKFKLSLNDLSSENLKRLIELTMQRLQIIQNFEEKLSVRHTIRYVLKELNFQISSRFLNDLNIMKSFARSQKSTFNTSIIKIFCELVVNSASNKM